MFGNAVTFILCFIYIEIAKYDMKVGVENSIYVKFYYFLLLFSYSFVKTPKCSKDYKMYFQEPKGFIIHIDK